MSASAFGAPPPDPVELSEPRAGDSLELGKGEVKIKPSHYLNAKKYDCTLTQGAAKWQSGPQEFPICTMKPADQAKFKSGPADVEVRAFVKNQWLAPAKAKIELKVAAPPPPPSVGASGEQMPPLNGIQVGTALPASWNSDYRGGGNSKTWKLLFCPSLYANLDTVKVSNGEVSFKVALGTMNESGAPSKRGPDEDAQIQLTGKIGPNFTVTATGALSPQNQAWIAAHPSAFPADGKSVKFVGKVENVNKHEGTSYEQGRQISGTVTSVGGDATCAFVSQAQDFKHTPDASWNELLRNATRKRDAGEHCISDSDCKSGACSKPSNHVNKCL